MGGRGVMAVKKPAPMRLSEVQLGMSDGFSCILRFPYCWRGFSTNCQLIAATSRVAADSMAIRNKEGSGVISPYRHDTSIDRS